MKKNIKHIILFTCACITIFSCGEGKFDRSLNNVENIVVKQPDSAIILLNMIKTSIMNPEQVRRHLLELYARDLMDEDISENQMIIPVIKYLTEVNNTKHMSLAKYYMGRILQSHGKMEEAMASYLDAKKYFESSDDNDIKGLIYSYIGLIKYNQGESGNAINDFKMAFEYFNRSQKSYKRKIAALNNLGNCFLMNKKSDSAMTCYDEALKLAVTAEDSATIKRNLGMAYIYTGVPDRAKQELFQALNQSRDSILQSLLYLNIGKAYEAQKLTDSAIYFAGLSTKFLTEQNDIYALATNYKLLSRLERKNGNCDKALFYNNKYIKIYTKIKDKNVINIQEIETRHKLYLLQRDLQSCKTKARLCFVALTILSIAIIYIIYNRKNKIAKKLAKLKISCEEKNKELDELKNKCKEKDKELDELKNSCEEKDKELDELKNNCEEKDKELDKLRDSCEEKDKELDELKNSCEEKDKELDELKNSCEGKSKELDEIKDTLTKTQSMASGKEEIRELYRSILENIYNDIEKLFPCKTMDDNSKSDDDIVKRLYSMLSTKNTWDVVYKMGKSTFDRIKTLYPKLSRQELKIVCLEYLGYTNTMTTYTVKLEKNTVQQNKTNIRHKLGIEQQGGSIYLFIMQQLEHD